jgi:single-strand DNA-binding protein
MNERYTTRDGEEREKTAFADVQVWGRQAETCSEYLSKGSPVLVEGKLQSESWEDRSSGERRSRTVIRAHRVQFLTTGLGGESDSSPEVSNASVARRADERVRSGSRRRSERGGGRN